MEQGVAELWSFLTFKLPGLLILLTIVVFIHEMGHFLVARWCGVRVHTFSIGFGRRSIGFNDRYGTRWQLAWIPLGGYVRFIDDENAASAPSREAVERLPESERSGAFQSKSIAQRAAIVIAGPLFNIISAMLIFFGFFWWFGLYETPAAIGRVVPGTPAEEAGLRPGDRLLAIDGRPLSGFADLFGIVGQSAEKPLRFTVDRGGQPLSVLVTPRIEISEPVPGCKIKVGKIGVGPPARTHVVLGGGESAVAAVRETGHLSWEIIKGMPKIPAAIGKVFRFQSQCDIGGPFTIADVTAQAATNGIESFIRWMAVFSVILGLMNLLPIPLLDGGHLVFYALEAVRGRPLDERKQELAFKFGLVIIATMMMAAFISDITRKLGLG